MLKKEDEFFASGDKKAIWNRYCGFLDLSVGEFLHIQKRLLTQQIAEIRNFNFYKDLMGEEEIVTIDEFRRIVPLTRYQDYATYLKDGQGNELPVNPSYWIYTSAPKGTYKYIPWTDRFNTIQCRNVVSALILSAATGPGDIQVKPGCKFLEIVPDRPFASGQLAWQLLQQFTINTIPPPDKTEHLPFNKKLDMSIELALKSDVDFVTGMTSSLLKFEKRFARLLPNIIRSPRAIMQLNAAVFWRLIRRLSISGYLPADVWRIKGIIGWGVDTKSLAPSIERQWGGKLLELYASSEGGIMGMQDWCHGPLALIPDVVFFEFIPHQLVSTDNPSTVLIDDVEQGKIYEPVITHLHGMPLVRYRMGDLVRFNLPEVNASLVPRIEFVGRADDLIDVFGIARINTDTIVRALETNEIFPDEWFLTKEFEHDRVVLRFYTEQNGSASAEKIKRHLNRGLKLVDRHWAEAIFTIGYNPLQIELVPPGTFRLLNNAQKRVRINPPESTLARIRPLKQV
ncbi:GH3 auxin-responsive promoter family protein [Chloroflexota bacterium]